MNTYRRTQLALAGLLLGAIVLSASGCAAGQAAAATVETRRSITVVGNGKATARPDMATTQIGVDIRDANIETASSQANDRVNQIIQALKVQGLNDQDIQTANFNIWVEQGPSGKPLPAIESAPENNTPLYHVVSTLNVTIRDLNKVGAVLDAAIKAGANTVSGVSFGIADTTKLESEARAKAIDNAKSRAADLARQAGVEVGDVLTISEVIGQSPVPMVMERANLASVGSPAPIQPGQLETSLQIQVIFAIK